MKRLALLLVLAACSPGKPPDEAKFWTAADFLDGQGQEKDFGGFTPDDLLRADGAPLRFQPGTQTGGPGLTLFPGVADRAPVAFAITDIWQDHPEPWVQPVWIPRDEVRGEVPGVLNVFPVDVDSTFYSPFWRAEFVVTAGLTDSTYRSARDVLSTPYERRSGAVILCPIVAEGGTLLANDGTGLKDPVTLRPITTLPTENSHAWVDGRQVTYLSFGLDRVSATEQDLIEAPAYFFVKSAGERPLPLSVVLPSEPQRNSLVRRVDVVLPDKAAVFVPSNRADLRALLPEGIDVPMVDSALDAFPELALRVVTDPACFEAANFPTACTWLDTPAQLEQLEKIVQPVQLAIGAAVAP